MSLTKVSYAMINATIANVLDYGAIGDGVADDTAAIRAAIAASNCVYIPSGTYKIARTGSEGVILGLKSNFRIYGDGDSSIIKFSSAVNSTNFWRAIGISEAGSTNYENITIENLALDGSTDKTEYSGSYEQNHGVFFFNTSGTTKNVVINNVYSYSFSGDSFVVSKGTNNYKITNCSATNWIRQGFNFSGIGNGVVTNNYALRMPTVTLGGSGLHCEPSGYNPTNIVVANNNVDYALLSGCVDLIISNNTVTNVILGNYNDGVQCIGNACHNISFGYTKKTSIIGNIVKTTDNATNGIYVVKVSSLGEDIVISNNRVIGSGSNTEIGIYVNQTDNNIISDNFITGFDYGIFTNGGSNYNIVGNYAKAGIWALTLSSSVTLPVTGSALVSGNTFSGTTADARIANAYFTDLRIGANQYDNGTISTTGSPIFRRLSPYTQKGTTANRPTGLSAITDIGYFYLDTTLDADGKPIWWNGTAWIDATGAVV